MRRRGRRRREFDVGELVRWSWGSKAHNQYYGIVVEKQDHMGVWMYTVMFDNQTVTGFNPEELKSLSIV